MILNRIAELAIKHRLPSMHADRPYVEAGGLMSYATNDADQFRRAAVFVDKILKGAKPADFPIEQPTKFEFVINLKTAKQIGLTIPPNVLARADRVIRSSHNPKSQIENPKCLDDSTERAGKSGQSDSVRQQGSFRRPA